MTSQQSGVKVAVVLCGSGRADGSEIHESVSVLIHLARLGVTYQCFAPDAPQAEVVNHLTDQIAPGATRNMLVEGARIARGDIKPIDRLKAADYDAVVFPGGNGAAKNLFTFASKGADCDVLPDAAKIVREFHEAKKPIGLCCIAPVMAARVLGTRMGGPGVKVTIGNNPEVAGAIAQMGSTNVAKGVTESFTDDANRVVTTPAYMYGDATPWQVYEGIGKMVEGVVALAKPGK